MQAPLKTITTYLKLGNIFVVFLISSFNRIIWYLMAHNVKKLIACCCFQYAIYETHNRCSIMQWLANKWSSIHHLQLYNIPQAYIQNHFSFIVEAWGLHNILISPYSLYWMRLKFQSFQLLYLMVFCPTNTALISFVLHDIAVCL